MRPLGAYEALRGLIRPLGAYKALTGLTMLMRVLFPGPRGLPFLILPWPKIALKSPPGFPIGFPGKPGAVGFQMDSPGSQEPL